jgi:hypothetical protein
MHRLNARLRKLERQLPQFDVSEFNDDDFTELARLLIREQFRARVRWPQAYFLMHSRQAQKEWCEFLRFSSTTPPTVIFDWFKIRASAMARYCPEWPPDDVSVMTREKLYAQIGLWDRFRKRPDWAWLFRRVAESRSGPNIGPEYAEDWC